MISVSQPMLRHQNPAKTIIPFHLFYKFYSTFVLQLRYDKTTIWWFGRNYLSTTLEYYQNEAILKHPEIAFRNNVPLVDSNLWIKNPQNISIDSEFGNVNCTGKYGNSAATENNKNNSTGRFLVTPSGISNYINGSTIIPITVSMPSTIPSSADVRSFPLSPVVSISEREGKGKEKEKEKASPSFTHITGNIREANTTLVQNIIPPFAIYSTFGKNHDNCFSSGFLIPSIPKVILKSSKFHI